MARIIPLKLNRNGKSGHRQKLETPPTVADRVARLREQLEGLELLAKAEATASKQLPSLVAFENVLKEKLDAVGRAVTELFLTHAEERVAGASKGGIQCGERFLRPAPQPQPRNLTGRFGVVRYFRTYMRENHAGRRRGFHPLDVTLGLSADRFSWNVLSLSARLATKVSFAEARSTLGLFLPNAPSTEVIEQTVLGLGKFTGDWFADLPAPEGDGEVLVVMIDSKGAPTATATELQRRRGKRRRKEPAPSPRHRGRHRRGLYSKKPRRKKGDIPDRLGEQVVGRQRWLDGIHPALSGVTRQRLQHHHHLIAWRFSRFLSCGIRSVSLLSLLLSQAQVLELIEPNTVHLATEPSNE